MPFDATPGPSQELPEVYRREGRRLRPSLQTEAELRRKAEEARTVPEREEANLDLEIFDLSHDPTGALKRETSGRDLADQLAEMMQSETEPAVFGGQPERLTPAFLVNMGELDRLNKVDYELGHQALIDLAQSLTEKLLTRLEGEAKTRGVDPESLFKIYRADSNSFMIRFTQDIPKALADELQAEMSVKAGKGWGSDENLFKKKGIEEPPVIADYVSLEEIVNGLPPSLRESGQAETYAVGALKDVLFTLQDARKIVSRTERIRDAIDSGKEAEAKELYDKFLQKSLAGVFSYQTGPEGAPIQVKEFEQFKGFLKSLEADRPVHGDAALWERAFAKGLGDLRTRYESNAKYSASLQSFVADKVKSEWGLEVEAERSLPAEATRLVPEIGTFAEPSKEEATEGLRIMTKLRADAEKEYANPQEKRMAQKRLERERLFRDFATGLELRGPLFKRLETALEDGQKRVAMVSIDMGFLKYFDQVGGRETGDLAILTAASIFQKIKDKYAATGLDVSAHRTGGDEFGLTVVGDASVDPETFRETLRQLQADLADEARSTGRIPAKTGAKTEYVPSELDFGVGAYHYDNAAAAADEDAKYALSKELPEGLLPGSPDAEAWVRNQRAEHLVKVSEKVMEFHKSANRFLFLLEKMKAIEEDKHAGKPQEEILSAEQRLEQLRQFSSKAVFGEKGQEKLDDWQSRIMAGESTEALSSEVHEFVWRTMDEHFREERGKQKEQETFIEYAVRIEYLNGRVEDLNKKLELMTGGDTSLRERYEHDVKSLQDRLASAEQDLSQVKALREAVRG